MRLFFLGLPLMAAATAPAAPTGEPVTFNKHVAPILWNNCAGCHRPGEVGPFPLLTYKDAAKRADFLKDVTASRRMPPWKAEPGFGEFHDVRRLSDEQIRTIAKWAESGAPEGDPKDLGKPPAFPEGWQLGKPDLILKMPEPFELAASGRDVYRCFVIPIPIDTDRTVAAVEFRPGNPKIVHHAILYLDNLGQGRAKNKSDGKPGFASFGGPGILPTGGLGGWAPGATPRLLPEGTGKFLRKGSDLILQIHYHPSGKAETDQSQVGVFFTKKPAEKIVAGISVAQHRLQIPAGDKHHAVSAQTAPLPADANLIGLSPHMHLLGKEMKVTAALPDGKTVPLIWIKDWDFNWQGIYMYEKPVRLPKGSVVKLEAAYDNSSDNPRNPNNPPKTTRWGEQTTDEMCLLSLQVTTDSLADLRQIATMRGNTLGTSLVGGPPPASREEASADKAGGSGGLPIPAKYKALLTPFDKNGDGKLSDDEIDAMPPVLRDRVRDFIEKNNPAPKK